MGGRGRDEFGRGAGREVASRIGTALLCRRMRWWKVDSDVPALVHLLVVSRDERTWAVAGRGLDQLRDDPRFTGRVTAALDEVLHRRSGPPPGVTSYLSGARLAGYLDRHGQAGHRQEQRADRFVDAFLATTDARARRDLFAVLATTDHPMLLRGIEDRLRRANPARWSELWTDGRPTPLMEILLANPHLPLPPGDGPPAHHDRAVLAVLKGRFDHGPDDGVNARAMITVLRLPAPEPIARTCRSLLRELPPGPGPEAVCSAAIDGNREAREAAVDAGYLPADDRTHPLFLFATEQWERYDRADPDGTLLREHCRGGIGLFAGQNVAAVAVRAGRPNPCPPPPPPPASRPATRPHGPIGSWPTSTTGGFGGI